ncbi:LD-carboxypeptidase [Haliscomenobacter sp.]|uniref:S66 peptidase family protein n=1 Tax=Haliscomenobacter sp. TaxID=2717303 RepID=UPI0035945546
MNRRFFTRNLALGTFLPFVMNGKKSNRRPERPALLKPHRLKEGDLVALITPGSYIPDSGLEKAVKNLEELGLRIAPGKNMRAKYGFVAGTDSQRLEDLHAAFANPEVKAVWCARGGYGCTRLLPYIDYQLIRKNPKVFIGYSDITALHLAFLQRAGLIGFHGPVASSTFNPYTVEHFRAVVMEGRSPHTIPLAEAYLEPKDDLYKYFTLRKGRVQGELQGGNLSLLAAMAGTEFGLDATNKLIFMEDIEERPYRIDRMLTQLRQSSNLHQAAGFALGIFDGCGPDEGENSLSLQDTVIDRLAEIPVPAAYGLSFGHISQQCTLPLGVMAELDTEARTLRLLESGVK